MKPQSRIFPAGLMLAAASVIPGVAAAAETYLFSDEQLPEERANSAALYSTFWLVPASESGLNYIGLTDSAAWGDFNGDGYPDLWFSKHNLSKHISGTPSSATLYLNQGNGTFVDITAEVVLTDDHGVAWADFDNDGDQDVIQLVGGAGGGGQVGNSPDLSNQMYVNEGGKLEDRAATLGIDYQNARGRTPLWLDVDRDGRLDLFVGAIPRPDGTFPPTIFRQTDSAFEDVRSTIGFELSNAPFALLSDLSGDGQVEAIFRSTPLTVYETSSVPWEDVTAALNLQAAIWASDIAAADFNGDLLPDLYLTRRGTGIAPLPDRILMNVGGQFVDWSMEAGINQIPNAGKGVVTGDFDNDMDIDIYVLATDLYANRPNILYENQGRGTFEVVPDAGGAAGTALGSGNAVTTVDYNLDGFLDLFVTNGQFPAQDGPLQLFRNQGNENSWLEIDLEGVLSNRDGIGAQVFLTAGGVTQLREQSGGTHHHAQNHQLLHFGLAGNTVIDQILIKWPSGLQQTLTDVSANQVLKITEGEVPNKAPTITAISNKTIDEDSSTGPLAFRVNDAETEPAALTLTARSSDQALIPDANLELSGTGTDRTINIMPKADRSGSSIAITVTVSDGEDAASSKFYVTVRPVNDPPMAQDDITSVDEGEFININVAENDSDVDDGLDLNSINIIAEPMNGNVTGRGNGTIDYAETAVGATSDIFTYTISDASGAASNIATVSVNIIPASSDERLTKEEAIALGLDPDDPDGDTDNDGVSDYVEVGGDPSNPPDSDGDGIIDAHEPGADAADAAIVSGLTLASGDAVTISTLAGESLSQVSITAAASAPAGVEFPFGKISYTTSSSPGGSVTVRLTFTVDLPENLVIYKVDSAGIYTELPTVVWTRVGSRMMDITLTDGDPMTDLDGVANGSIDDPIALGSVVPASTSGVVGPDGGGGCVFSSAAGKDAVLPLIFLASLILLSRKHLRYQI